MIQVKQFLKVTLCYFVAGCGDEKRNEAPLPPSNSPVHNVEVTEEEASQVLVDDQILSAMADGSFEQIWKLYQFNTVADEKVFYASLRAFITQYPNSAGDRLAEFLRDHIKEKESQDLFNFINRMDPVIAFEFVTKGYGDPQKGNAQVKAIHAMIEGGSIEEAIDRTERIPSFDARALAIWAIAHNMSDEDLLKHGDWIEPMLPEEKEGLIRGLGSDRLPSLVELESWPLRELLGDQIRPGLVKDLARGLHELRSVEEIEARFDQFNDLGLSQNDREIIEKQWASSVGQSHPEDAVWVVELMQYEGERLVLSSIGATLDDESPQEAFDLASRLPSEYHDVAADRIIRSWYRNDPIAASTYVTQMKPGSLRDHAALGLAERLESDGRSDESNYWRQWAGE